MAAGDAVTAVSSVASGSYIALQPASGVEWIIHNVNVPEGTTAELYKYDGTNDIKVNTSNGGGWLGFFFHCTNGIYYRIKNTSGSSAYIGYDGIVSKE